MIESTYKVSRRADDRAVAGLSMGGGQTVNVAFNRPDLFRYVGIMSAAAGANPEQQYAAVFKDPSQVNRQFKLFWIASGKDDALVGANLKTFVEALNRAGVKHTFTLTEGRHEWTVWRHHLRDLAPLLFR
jgi:enterochelin esterase family protein